MAIRQIRGWIKRLGGLFHRQQRDAEFNAELDSNLELHIAENIRRGMSPAEARRAALVALGGVEFARESHRDQRGFRLFDSLAQDLCFALRMLRKNPGFAVTAILTLALGIGANTAIFSVFNTVLIANVPFRDPGRLVMLWANNPEKQGGVFAVSPAVYAAWKAQNGVFEDMAASQDDLAKLTEGGEPEITLGYDFSAEYFPILGVRPALGRTFLPEDERPDAPNVVVLSDKLWRRRFAADAAIVGKTIHLGSTPFTVIGVMPATFRWPDKVELWMPLQLAPSDSGNWTRKSLRVVARLKPGITIEQAQARMNALAQQIARDHPDTNAGEGVEVESIRHRLAGDIERPLFVLLGAVGLVLLIACVNVAGLLLARTAARSRELAVRSALGASRARLVRQLITESIVLASAGGAAGLLLAFAATGCLLKIFPNNIANLSIPTVDAIPLDGRVLAFTLAATLLTGVLFGLFPALVGMRPGANERLKQAGRGSGAGAGERRARSLLVVGEISLAFVLLIGAGLFVRGFLRLLDSSLGFQPDRVLALELFLSPAKYKPQQPEKVRAFVDQALANLRATPGVVSAGAINFLPLTGFWGSQEFRIEGRPAPEKGRVPTADNRVVAPDYFRSMGVTLLRGRDFTAQDGPGSPHVVIVSAALAQRYWPGADPIGRRINLDDDGKPNWCEIIGVASDVHSFGLEETLHDDLYRPFSQVWFPIVAFTVKTTGDPEKITAAAKSAIWKLDSSQPFYKVMTMDALAAESTALRRVSTLLLSAFSALALILAAVGIYGVLSYSVAQRTHEIGIRTALGANPGEILRLVLGEGLRITLAGIGFGLAGALALSQLVSSMLFGIGARDPFTFAAVAAISAAVAFAACYLPARRAARVDPLVALRYE